MSRTFPRRTEQPHPADRPPGMPERTDLLAQGAKGVRDREARRELVEHELSGEELALHAQMELPGAPNEIAVTEAIHTSHILWNAAEKCERLAEMLRELGDHETKRLLLDHAKQARSMSRKCSRIAGSTDE
jgi:hypothetical protein